MVFHFFLSFGSLFVLLNKPICKLLDSYGFVKSKVSPSSFSEGFFRIE